MVKDLQPKTPRKRVANFTAHEKALLKQLIKKRPIIEVKLTDGKSVAKKQVAWKLLTQEFNSKANVHKRETLTLKRAWDNMKAYTRKARATDRGDFSRTGGGPPAREAISNMAQEVTPAIISGINHTFDSDGAILKEKESSIDSYSSILDTDESMNEGNNSKENNVIINQHLEDTTYNPVFNGINKTMNSSNQVRQPTDSIRREAVIRMKRWENKQKIEMEILKTQLEVQQIKKQGALFKEERNRIKLEKAKIELEELKKSIEKQNTQN